MVLTKIVIDELLLLTLGAWLPSLDEERAVADCFKEETVSYYLKDE